MSVGKIKTKERSAILDSLRAGVVPNIGIQHIQVGRNEEVKAIIKEIEKISDSGSSVKFIIGEYGSGKSFFLHLTRAIAHQKILLQFMLIYRQIEDFKHQVAKPEIYFLN